MQGSGGRGLCEYLTLVQQMCEWFEALMSSHAAVDVPVARAVDPMSPLLAPRVATHMQGQERRHKQSWAEVRDPRVALRRSGAPARQYQPWTYSSPFEPSLYCACPAANPSEHTAVVPYRFSALSTLHEARGKPEREGSGAL